MKPNELAWSIAALIVAVAALIRALTGAVETRFADLRKEIAILRAALETEQRLRVGAQRQASDAEKRAEAAEAEVAALILVNERMRAEIDLMRAAIIGSAAEANEARIELARRADDAARKRAAGAVEETAPHKAQKEKP